MAPHPRSKKLPLAPASTPAPASAPESERAHPPRPLTRPRSAIISFLNHPTHIYTAALALRLFLLVYGLVQDAYSHLRYTDIDYFVFTDAARYSLAGLKSALSSRTEQPLSPSPSFGHNFGAGSDGAGTVNTSPYDRATYRYTPLLAWILVPTAISVPSSRVATAALFSFGKVLFAAADVVVGYLIVRICRASDRPSARSTKRSSSSSSSLLSPTSHLSPTLRAHAVGAVWLLNPMVATISTRGSAEAVLAVLVTGAVAAVLARRHVLAGVLVGLSVHFKLYPVIYAPSVVLWLTLLSAEYERSRLGSESAGAVEQMVNIVRTVAMRPPSSVLRFAASATATFAALNGAMFAVYGSKFLFHTYFYHLIRIDHRHNFSVYNTVLHLSHADAGVEGAAGGGLKFETVAFVPQLVLAGVAIPVALFLGHDRKRFRRGQGATGMVNMEKMDPIERMEEKASPTARDLPPLLLPAVLFLQTFAFVTFNKVCTSQYFLWYLNLLPFVIAGCAEGKPGERMAPDQPSSPSSSPSRTRTRTRSRAPSRPSVPLGAALALAGWASGQAAWLHQAYGLEFLGRPTFVPGLWAGSVAFFGVNVAVLAWLIRLVGSW